MIGLRGMIWIMRAQLLTLCFLMSGCSALGTIVQELDEADCYDAKTLDEFRACAGDEAESMAVEAAWKVWESRRPDMEDKARRELAKAVHEARGAVR